MEAGGGDADFPPPRDLTPGELLRKRRPIVQIIIRVERMKRKRYGFRNRWILRSPRSAFTRQ